MNPDADVRASDRASDTSNSTTEILRACAATAVLPEGYAFAVERLRVPSDADGEEDLGTGTAVAVTGPAFRRVLALMIRSSPASGDDDDADWLDRRRHITSAAERLAAEAWRDSGYKVVR